MTAQTCCKNLFPVHIFTDARTAQIELKSSNRRPA